MGQPLQQKKSSQLQSLSLFQQIIPFHRIRKKGALLAVLLFIAQFVYYQFQPYLMEGIQQAKWWAAIQIPFLNQPENLLHCWNIGVHAAFSILIVAVLYRDRHSTWLVFYLSVLLAALYVLSNVAYKLSGYFVLDIISTKILFFIASPFKTIFSIPALKLKHGENSTEDSA